MQHPPAESALYRPPVRQWGESFLAGVLADDLDVDAVRGAALDDAALIAAVCPGLDHPRVAGGELVSDVPAAGGVLHAGRSHQQDQQEPERKQEPESIGSDGTLSPPSPFL